MRLPCKHFKKTGKHNKKQPPTGKHSPIVCLGTKLSNGQNKS